MEQITIATKTKEKCKAILEGYNKKLGISENSKVSQIALQVQ